MRYQNLRASYPAWRSIAAAIVVVGLGLGVLPGRAVAQNQPPTVPVLNNPSERMASTTTTPVFSWAASTDPEGDAITYDIEVRDSSGALWASVSGVTGTVTSIGSELTNRETYTWRARATDAAGAASELSPENRFEVNAPVDCPELIVGNCGCGGCDYPDDHCNPETGPDDGGCQSTSAPGAGSVLGALGLLVVLRRRRRRG